MFNPDPNEFYNHCQKPSLSWLGRAAKMGRPIGRWGCVATYAICDWLDGTPNFLEGWGLPRNNEEKNCRKKGWGRRRNRSTWIYTRRAQKSTRICWYARYQLYCDIYCPKSRVPVRAKEALGGFFGILIPQSRAFGFFRRKITESQIPWIVIYFSAKCERIPEHFLWSFRVFLQIISFYFWDIFDFL